jgi:hypothetical protein
MCVYVCALPDFVLFTLHISLTRTHTHTHTHTTYTTQSRPVESDNALVREVLSSLQRRHHQHHHHHPQGHEEERGTEAAVGGRGWMDADVHTLVSLAPCVSRRQELLPLSSWGDPVLQSLREKGRVRSCWGGGGGGEEEGVSVVVVVVVGGGGICACACLCMCVCFFWGGG